MKRESGAVILPLCLILVAVTSVIFLYASELISKVGHRYTATQAMSYAHQISTTLARQLRWSYDMAKAYQIATAAGLDASKYCAPADIVTVGAARLCLSGNKTCVKHPGSIATPPTSVCVGPGDNSLLARLTPFPANSRTSVADRISVWALPSAFAQAPPSHAPPPPVAGETTNDLATPPVCLGGACVLTCGTNADCLTFSFCPLPSGTCETDQKVSQTVAFPRAP